MRLQREETDIQRLSNTSGRAQKSARCSTTEDWKHVTLQLDVCIVVSHGIVLFQSEGVYPDHVLHAAPPLAIFWVETHVRRYRPIDLHKPNSVVLEERSVAFAEATDVLSRHQHHDVDAVRILPFG
eukprot:CAMPEP_0203898640 /NCGR_PEP_ID=MMETSP0359-20131031/41157_1 /ASSEMBLY_ACC=CAM_ASM_000338 /TAXON_ID=268821 /ORGANISM="Scrippsiella Hangoei, Strain SHTV-5" /LENGTH=125 /DNA_ID=CAMNT_0050821755 /DNA_START=658 /DNA_END=1031 /DNA_ORIENTATION=-